MPTFLLGSAEGVLGRDHRLSVRHGIASVLARADLVLVVGAPLDFRMQYGMSIGQHIPVITVKYGFVVLYRSAAIVNDM